eukprot:213749_1
MPNPDTSHRENGMSDTGNTVSKTDFTQMLNLITTEWEVRDETLNSSTGLIKTLKAKIDEQSENIEGLELSNDRKDRTIAEQKSKIHKLITKVSELTMVELTYKRDFDTNGLFYHIGTNNGTTDFQNPVESGNVTVNFTSENEGSGSNVVSRRKLKTYTEDEPEQMMITNISAKEKRFLIPNFYTIRHGNPLEFFCLRNWNLEAMIEPAAGDDPDEREETWLILREHRNDESIVKAFQSHSWPLEEKCDDKGNPLRFQKFRIRQTGANSSDTNHLNVGGLELYGKLYTMDV